MAEDLSAFFDVDDELVTTGTLSTGGDLIGFFDINSLDLYADGSESALAGQFVCQDWPGRAASIGANLTVGAASYVIQNAVPDGTGLVTLNLIVP